jgi:hypothetical protein
MLPLHSGNILRRLSPRARSAHAHHSTPLSLCAPDQSRLPVFEITPAARHRGARPRFAPRHCYVMQATTPCDSCTLPSAAHPFAHTDSYKLIVLFHLISNFMSRCRRMQAQALGIARLLRGFNN